MKLYHWIIILLIGAGLTACKDDAASAGAGALGINEDVRVSAATLGGIHSQTSEVKDFSITQTPDSFLLGEYNTEELATIKADILAQFACPIGSAFPDSSHIDSIALVMTYSSWFGDGQPLRISVYEMDKEPLYYDSVYTSQVDRSRYWSEADSTHVVEKDQVITASQPSDSVYSNELSRYLPYVRFKMNEQFVERFNTIHKFPSLEVFTKWFKGLYITTTYGASTALYVDNLTMVIYYHYYYKDGAGNYSKNNDTKYLYANSEVRQINRFSFPNKEAVIAKLRANDSLDHVVSPGYVYTTIELPLDQYLSQITDSVVDNKSMHAYINKATMRMDVINIDTDGNATKHGVQPASDMLLIRKDKLSEFFATSNVPSSDYCLFSSLYESVDDQFNHTYYYLFDFSTILQNAISNSSETPSKLEMVMVPVFVEYTTSSSSSSVSISRVKINQTITWTILRSAQNKQNPMNIDAVFSGFYVGGIE